MPKCAPGVSVVLDGCGCCKVCARQLNEDCSLTEPCDHTKGLECNFGASFAAATTRGICRGMYKRPFSSRCCMKYCLNKGGFDSGVWGTWVISALWNADRRRLKPQSTDSPLWREKRAAWRISQFNWSLPGSHVMSSADVFWAEQERITFLSSFFSPLAAKSEGRPCEYNSRIYQNGESFQPNCKHQCTCIDGAVGCVPLCPQELSLPNLGCANPRLVKVAGQCCEEWVCDDGKETDILEKIFGKDMMTDELERDLTNRNELIAIVKGGLKSLPGKKAVIMELFFSGYIPRKSIICRIQRC